MIEDISLGMAPPLVSQRTTHSAPDSAATEITSIAYSGFFLYPSKKCSASKKTLLLLLRKYSIESLIIDKFSSKVVSKISVTCKSQLFPTKVITDT